MINYGDNLGMMLRDSRERIRQLEKELEQLKERVNLNIKEKVYCSNCKKEIRPETDGVRDYYLCPDCGINMV